MIFHLPSLRRSNASRRITLLHYNSHHEMDDTLPAKWRRIHVARSHRTRGPSLCPPSVAPTAFWCSSTVGALIGKGNKGSKAVGRRSLRTGLYRGAGPDEKTEWNALPTANAIRANKCFLIFRICAIVRVRAQCLLEAALGEFGHGVSRAADVQSNDAVPLCPDCSLVPDPWDVMTFRYQSLDRST